MLFLIGGLLDLVPAGTSLVSVCGLMPAVGSARENQRRSDRHFFIRFEQNEKRDYYKLISVARTDSLLPGSCARMTADADIISGSKWLLEYLPKPIIVGSIWPSPSAARPGRRCIVDRRRRQPAALVRGHVATRTDCGRTAARGPAHAGCPASAITEIAPAACRAEYRCDGLSESWQEINPAREHARP